MNPPKAERNARLLARREEGATYAKLAEEFHICLQRAAIICCEERQRRLIARLRRERQATR